MINGLSRQPRRVFSYAPSGPAAAMIDNETNAARPGKKKQYGVRHRLFEQAIVEHLGRKYPKLLERWKILQEEKHGVVA